MHPKPYLHARRLGAEEGFFAATLICVVLGMVLPAGGLAIGAWHGAGTTAATERAAMRAPACRACLAGRAHVS